MSSVRNFTGSRSAIPTVRQGTTLRRAASTETRRLISLRVIGVSRKRKRTSSGLPPFIQSDVLSSMTHHPAADKIFNPHHEPDRSVAQASIPEKPRGAVAAATPPFAIKKMHQATVTLRQ